MTRSAYASSEGPRRVTERPRIVLDDDTERLSVAGDDAEWWLVVIEGGRSVAHRLPRGRPLSVGRSEDCDIQIDDPSISRRHAQVLVGPPACIQDLGSANGVRVGRRPLEARMLTPVEPGQAIELGAVLAVIHRPSMLPVGAVPAARAPEPQERPSAMPDGPPLIRDPAMREVMDLIARVAPSELSVLLTGETGVGKEIVAAAVHHGSPRAAAPFLRVNCAALTESLAESELFGHARGAFTGAVEARAGIFEAADGGTVFLDEVGDLSPAIQAKLLRVLETREVTRVGAVEARRVDVRFVSATNRDLTAAVASGAFRQDLFFRLHGIGVEVPPLRERPLDLRPLAERFARRGRGGPVEITDEAARALERHPWPGNVRELRNAMERAAVLAGEGSIERDHLPEAIRDAGREEPAKAASVRGELEQVERRRILEALAETSGNQTKAAARIGMPRRTFLKRLDAYGIARPRKGRGSTGGDA